MYKSKKILIEISTILIISLLMFAGCTDQSQDDADADNNSNSNISGTVVATVNGEEITSDEVSYIQQSYEQQGQQISEEDALEQLINQEILFQKAQQEGFNLTDEETEAEIEKLLGQQGMTLEDYKDQLEQQGISYEENLQKFKEQFIIEEYQNKALEGEDFNATEEEAEEYYNLYKQQNPENTPAYEEIKDQIIDYLQQQKRQEAINSLVQVLREDADIKYN